MRAHAMSPYRHTDAYPDNDKLSSLVFAKRTIPNHVPPVLGSTREKTGLLMEE